MATKTLKYTLEDINTILFNGFDHTLSEETLEIISNLALQVGSPDYVKTPIFKKRENPMKTETPAKDLNGGFKKGKRNNKNFEVVNDDDWETIRTFQTTKMDEKSGIDSQIDMIRINLNKMSDKNYIDMRNKIIEIIDNLVNESITTEDMARFSSTIFEIASTNRFYSKIYADLYADLCKKYQTMKDVFEINFSKFIDLFNNIEYVDPTINYDKFCEINKINEKRKALSTFYVNLMNNDIISKTQIMNITRNLLCQIYTFISIENKKNEVDELTETIAILYKKELYDDDEDEDAYELINGFTINEIVEKIANSKVKDYKSLTNKSLFKFMDLIEM
jgi:hypothetical protein